MSDIPSAGNKIQIEGVQFRSSVSEDVAVAIGAAANYALDQVIDHEPRISALETLTASQTTQINSILTELSDHESRIDSLEVTATSLDSRLDSAETTLSTHTTQIASLDDVQDDQETRIGDLESSLSTERSEMNNFRNNFNAMVSFQTLSANPGVPMAANTSDRLAIFDLNGSGGYSITFVKGADTYTMTATNEPITTLWRLGYTATLTGTAHSVSVNAIFIRDTTQGAFTF